MTDAQTRRAISEHNRQVREAEKLRAAIYLDGRRAEADRLNKENSAKAEKQASILANGVSKKFKFDLNNLPILNKASVFSPPKELTNKGTPPNENDFMSKVPKYSFFQLLFNKNKEKLKREQEEAKENFEKALSAFTASEKAREDKLAKLKEDHWSNYNALKEKISKIRSNYETGDPHGLVEYITFNLDQHKFVDGFEESYKLAFNQDSNEIVIEFELPNKTLITEVSEYRYVKTNDQIVSKAKRETEITKEYTDLISSICLLTIHYIFSADDKRLIDVVTFNGFTHSIDLATGKNIRPYLISVRTTRDRFEEIDLLKVDKKICLKNLGAHLSPKPADMQAVKPIIDFNMVDKRFVEQNDIAESLESRPNLMDLNPFEFENLVSNLFSKMGLETKQTRSSKDGGVDAIAYDNRPVLGGKVIIQAKRYKNVVGVAFVRDLYGTMMNEGANKGILVTTSGYGPDAFDFAKDKPIELIDGGGLLYLLNQVGIEARILIHEESLGEI
jgi:restriction system protein